MGCKYDFRARIKEGRTHPQSGFSLAGAPRWLVSYAHPQESVSVVGVVEYRPHMGRGVYHVFCRMFVGFLHPSTARIYDES